MCVFSVNRTPVGIPVIHGREDVNERVVIAYGTLEIGWSDQGWQELAGELTPGTIGSELRKW